MTRKELIGAVAIKCSMPTAQAAKVIDATIGEIKHELIVMHGSVDLPGFGIFGIKEFAARKGTNPRTGKPMDVPARKVPYFHAGRALREAVKQ